MANANTFIINLQVEKNHLSFLDVSSIVSGSKGYYKFACDFSADWDGTDRFVIFPTFGENGAYEKFDENNQSEIPEEIVSSEGILQFGIVGIENGGELNSGTERKLRITTDWLELTISDGTYEVGYLASGVTETWADKIESIVTEVTKSYLQSNVVDSSVKEGIIIIANGDGGIEAGEVTLSDLQSIADDVYSKKMDKQNELLSEIVSALQ